MTTFKIPTVIVDPPSDNESDVMGTQDDEDLITPQDHADTAKVPTEDVESQSGIALEERSQGGMNLQNGEPPANNSLTRNRGLQRKKTNHLKTIENEFVQSIRRRDVNKVEATMKIAPGLHDLEDFYGRSALEHAVVAGSVEIVERLLEQNPHLLAKLQAIERAMLYAIKENDIVMMDRLITIQQDAMEQNDRDGSKSSDPSKIRHPPKPLSNSISLDIYHEDSEFSQEIKPMLLAAQMNRVEIVEMLYQRCPPIIHPITRECPNPKQCLACQYQVCFVGRQSIEDCKQTLDVYKALSSPAYLFHTGAQDPILEAFVISHHMEKRKVIDPAYYSEYSAISLQCRVFVTTLLDLCRSVDEVQTLFHATEGIERAHRTKYHQARFPRLLLALYFSQKEFVAHPHCQQVMQNEWYHGLPEWVCYLKQHQLRFAAYTTLLFLFMPFIFVLYLLRVKSIERFVKPAANKFILDMSSFIYFLIMLFLKVSLGLNTERGRQLSVIDTLLFIWVIGQTIRYVNMSTRRKDECNLYWLNPENSNWRFFELITLVCFWLQYMLLIGVWIHMSSTGEAATSREKLSGTDAYLCSELFGAVASCLTVAHVYSYFKVSSSLGPLQVSLKKIIFDVIKFMVLFLVVLSAFAIGLSSLYSGYKGITVTDMATQQLREQDDAFTNILRAYKRLFWDLFNYGNEEYAALVLGHSSSHHKVNVTGINGTSLMMGGSHRLTEMTGYILYGAYHITVIIVLLNMLIAMMANSYNNIEANADTEWKFARTRLFMNYFNEIGVLCPPFNLLPIRALLALLGKKFKCCSMFRRQTTHLRKWDCKKLMIRLRKRYWKLQLAKELSRYRKVEGDVSMHERTRAHCSREPNATLIQDCDSVQPTDHTRAVHTDVKRLRGILKLERDDSHGHSSLS